MLPLDLLMLDWVTNAISFGAPWIAMGVVTLLCCGNKDPQRSGSKGLKGAKGKRAKDARSKSGSRSHKSRASGSKRKSKSGKSSTSDRNKRSTANASSRSQALKSAKKGEASSTARGLPTKPLGGNMGPGSSKGAGVSQKTDPRLSTKSSQRQTQSLSKSVEKSTSAKQQQQGSDRGAKVGILKVDAVGAKGAAGLAQPKFESSPKKVISQVKVKETVGVIPPTLSTPSLPGQSQIEEKTTKTKIVTTIVPEGRLITETTTCQHLIRAKA